MLLTVSAASGVAASLTSSRLIARLGGAGSTGALAFAIAGVAAGFLFLATTATVTTAAAGPARSAANR